MTSMGQLYRVRNILAIAISLEANVKVILTKQPQERSNEPCPSLIAYSNLARITSCRGKGDEIKHIEKRLIIL